ncbi:hypothetical protein CEUSTIGMA_g10487.t1 [Chlamydomonas eustigma]|uniref:Uncharacterized protein n=1 Tax=Chlamydomonas eustigma TaxID=1157962 RepID=A0A250XJ00_9CHLO|nr:hypothetical protein CEUSTIGMA_g10487.t1 [Chlamydomonas eustigma]|eukprot:GAX83061.1 hypothetical protein CEUSTIGMA_g10487.t1 [Chlamydomonas eustigma]
MKSLNLSGSKAKTSKFTSGLLVSHANGSLRKPSSRGIWSDVNLTTARCLGHGDVDDNYRHIDGNRKERQYDMWDNNMTDFSNSSDSTGDDLMAVLRKSHLWALKNRPSVNLLTADMNTLARIPEVYMIMFKARTREEEEGIYSLRATGPDGLPKEMILAFEDRDDADRYAGQLEVTMEPHKPTVCEIQVKMLVSFCQDRGYQCRCEPCGSVLMPPEASVGLTDWERTKKLRSGHFQVLEAEPTSVQREGLDHDVAIGSGNVAVLHSETSPTTPASPSDSGLSFIQDPSSMNEEELIAMRRHLETLLP